MAKLAIKNYTQLVAQLNKATEIAVRNTSNILLEKLKEIIQTEYYDQYEPSPNGYNRTYMFLNSAVAKMVTNSSATIGIDDVYLDYEYPAQYTSHSANISKSDNVHWTGEDQLEMSSRGYHGNVSIKTEGRWFKSFIDYCDKNARQILREELIKQGVPLK